MAKNLGGEPRLNFALRVLFMMFITITPAVSSAQPFPTQPIRMVNPMAQSSATDLGSRFLAQEFSKRLGVPVIVVNMPGADTMIGTQSVLRTQPLAYQLLYAQSSVITNIWARKNPGYKREDLHAIGPMGIGEYALTINSKFVPVKTLSEFVAYARANPRKLNYSAVSQVSANVLLTERFLNEAKIQVIAIPYKGGGASLVDFIAGIVQVNMANLGATLPRIRQNPSFVSLAVTGDHRATLMPDVPTFKEQGYSSMTGTAYWITLFSPSAAPRADLRRLEQVMAEVSATTEMKELLQRLNMEPWTGSREEWESYLDKFSASLQADFKRLKIPALD
jgi:tripartite-type tricarboxylate transporter receptor subunit TctC